MKFYFYLPGQQTVPSENITIQKNVHLTVEQFFLYFVTHIILLDNQQLRLLKGKQETTAFLRKERK